MFSQVIRNYTRKFFEGAARILGATGISPNVITITGTLLMIVVAIVIAQGYLVWGGIWWICQKAVMREAGFLPCINPSD